VDSEYIGVNSTPHKNHGQPPGHPHPHIIPPHPKLRFHLLGVSIYLSIGVAFGVSLKRFASPKRFGSGSCCLDPLSAMAMGNQNAMHMCLCFFSRSCFRTCCAAWEHGQQFSCEPHHNISKAVKVRHARIRAVISIDLRKKTYCASFNFRSIDDRRPIAHLLKTSRRSTGVSAADASPTPGCTLCFPSLGSDLRAGRLLVRVRRADPGCFSRALRCGS
jgi:hypothetical protein